MVKQTQTIGIKQAEYTRKDCDLTAVDMIMLYALTTRCFHTFERQAKQNKFGWLEVYMLLVIRENPGITYREIRLIYGSSSSGLSFIFNQLRKNGLVVCSVDERDTRCRKYEITKDGIKHLEEQIDTFNKILEVFNNDLTSKAKFPFKEALRNLGTYILEMDKIIYDSDNPYDLKPRSSIVKS